MNDHAMSEKPELASSYAEASARIDEILAQLERNDRVDVDHLAERVAEASALIRFCRAKLRATEVEVTRIVTELAGGSAGDAGETAAAVDDSEEAEDGTDPDSVELPF